MTLTHSRYLTFASAVALVVALFLPAMNGTFLFVGSLSANVLDKANDAFLLVILAAALALAAYRQVWQLAAVASVLSTLFAVDFYSALKDDVDAANAVADGLGLASIGIGAYLLVAASLVGIAGAYGLYRNRLSALYRSRLRAL